MRQQDKPEHKTENHVAWYFVRWTNCFSFGSDNSRVLQIRHILFYFIQIPFLKPFAMTTVFFFFLKSEVLYWWKWNSVCRYCCAYIISLYRNISFNSYCTSLSDSLESLKGQWRFSLKGLLASRAGMEFYVGYAGSSS